MENVRLFEFEKLYASLNWHVTKWKQEKLVFNYERNYQLKCNCVRHVLNLNSAQAAVALNFSIWEISYFLWRGPWLTISSQTSEYQILACAAANVLPEHIWNENRTRQADVDGILARLHVAKLSLQNRSRKERFRLCKQRETLREKSKTGFVILTLCKKCLFTVATNNPSARCLI